MDSIIEQKNNHKKCTIECTDWNDGIFDGYIVNEDKEFFYYVIPDKKETKIGMLAKKYITEIKDSDSKDKVSVDLQKYSTLNKDYFVGKKICLYLNERRFWYGIFGKETEYLDVIISEFKHCNIIIKASGLISDIAIKISDIVKIEM